MLHIRLGCSNICPENNCLSGNIASSNFPPSYGNPNLVPPLPPFFFSLKNSSQNPQSSFPSYKKYFIRHDKMITKQNYGRVWRTDKKRISKRHKEKKYMRRREYRSDPCYLWYLRCTRATRLSRPQWKFDWRDYET